MSLAYWKAYSHLVQTGHVSSRCWTQGWHGREPKFPSTWYSKAPFWSELLSVMNMLLVFVNTEVILSVRMTTALHEHQGCYWRKKLPWTILEEQFSVPRYTTASKIGNSVISLLWQLRCRCNPDHNKFSSLSNTTVVAIFPKLCLRRRSLCSNLGGTGPEKLYRATLITKCIYYEWASDSFAYSCPCNNSWYARAYPRVKKWYLINVVTFLMILFAVQQSLCVGIFSLGFSFPCLIIVLIVPVEWIPKFIQDPML